MVYCHVSVSVQSSETEADHRGDDLSSHKLNFRDEFEPEIHKPKEEKHEH